MRWIYKRAVTAAITIYSTITIIFFLIRLMPGNPIDYLLISYIEAGMPYEQAYQTLSAMFSISLTEPLYMQYFKYIINVFRGDLGKSIIYKVSISEILAYAIPWTIFTVSLGLLLSFSTGILLGLISAYKRSSLIDKILSSFASASIAVPNYVFAYFFIMIFVRFLGLFPIKGAYDPIKVTPGFNIPFILDVLHHAILPMLCYFIAGFGTWLLRMRNSAISVLGEQYTFFARARGLSERRIMWKYVGRNAMLPVFAIFAISVGYIFGGSALIENIFQYPGIGFFISYGVYTRDYTLMQGVFLILTISVTLANLIADLLYVKLDPRVKRE
jgi:peptide/nickel transport system permease protein